MRLLIGFGNRARQGKDTAAEAVKHWMTHTGADFPEVRIMKFASALYDTARKEYGMTEKDAPLLQRIGQERREQNPRYWIDRLFFDNKNFHGISLISDVRYLNEAHEIRSRGGYLINVRRLNEDGTPFITDDRPADHPSETELDGFNWDGYITTKTGQEALTAELAVTMVNFFYEITEPVNV